MGLIRWLMALVALLGAGLLTAGVALIYVPAGLIVGGGMLLAAGLTVDTGEVSE
jgi:hypothetical protein